MNTKISIFVICVEAMIYLLLRNLHYCTFKQLNNDYLENSESTSQHQYRH